MLDRKRDRVLEVKSIRNLSENLKRLTFNSSDLFDFKKSDVGGYIKLKFINNCFNNHRKYLLRPFTIRAYRTEDLEIDIDFVIHNKGLASKWVKNAKVGDRISISGLGKKQELNLKYDWFFFIGDLSALPAISVNLETINKNSRGIIILETLSKSDQIIENIPENFSIHWVLNSEPHISNDLLLNKIKKINWLEGNPFIWTACEFSNMKKIRKFFFSKCKIIKEQIYISSYWKAGLDQERHKEIKKIDSNNWESNF